MSSYLAAASNGALASELAGIMNLTCIAGARGDLARLKMAIRVEAARSVALGLVVAALVDDLDASAEPMFRARLGYRIAERHLITALYAPLQLEASGAFDRDVLFEGKAFAAGAPVLATYRFDSYRLTYRFSVVRNQEWDLAAGLTGKIRDAEISLYGAETASKTNTGFVPLLHIHAQWRPGGGVLGLVLDAGALAAPQGRAEDVLLALTWDVHEAITLRVGYRMLEGGAENDEVYNFAWIHYGVAGVSLQL